MDDDRTLDEVGETELLRLAVDERLGPVAVVHRIVRGLIRLEGRNPDRVRRPGHETGEEDLVGAADEIHVHVDARAPKRLGAEVCLDRVQGTGIEVGVRGGVGHPHDATRPAALAVPARAVAHAVGRAGLRARASVGAGAGARRVGGADLLRRTVTGSVARTVVLAGLRAALGVTPTGTDVDVTGDADRRSVAGAGSVARTVVLAGLRAALGVTPTGTDVDVTGDADRPDVVAALAARATVAGARTARAARAAGAAGAGTAGAGIVAVARAIGRAVDVTRLRAALGITRAGTDVDVAGDADPLLRGRGRRRRRFLRDAAEDGGENAENETQHGLLAHAHDHALLGW